MMTSKLGLTLSGAYILLAIALISTQGLFGESFIAIILGMPISLLFSWYEFGGAEGPLLVAMLLFPLAVNAALLYWIGSMISRAASRPKA